MISRTTKASGSALKKMSNGSIEAKLQEQVSYGHGNILQKKNRFFHKN